MDGKSTTEQAATRMEAPNHNCKEALFHQYEKLLCSVARRYQFTCGYQEAYQEACVALLAAIHGYDPARGPFAAYAAAKVRGDVRTAMRRTWRAAERAAFMPDRCGDDGAVDEFFWQTIRDPMDIETIVLRRSALRQLLHFAQLSTRERTWLAGFQAGLTQEMLAKQIGVSIETVKTWRGRALRKLRFAAERLQLAYEDFMEL